MIQKKKKELIAKFAALNLIEQTNGDERAIVPVFIRTASVLKYPGRGISIQRDSVGHAASLGYILLPEP